MDAIFNAIADLFQHLFDLMPKLGNIPNAILTLLGIAGFITWASLLYRYKKQGGNE